MNDTDVRHVFDRVLTGEPELSLTAASVDNAIHRTHRRQVMRRSIAGSALAVVAALGVGLPLLNNKTADTQTNLTISAASRVIAAPTTPISLVAEDPTFAAIRAAIDAHTPDGWTIDLKENTAFGYGLDGTVDDGAGPGRLLVAVAIEKRMQQVHPCKDSDFKQGVACTESTLPDGSVLSVRELVDFKGIQTYAVVLTHPDGTGSFIESGNFSIPDERKPITPEDKGRLVPITRAAPTYSLENLVEMVKAVDAASR